MANKGKSICALSFALSEIILIIESITGGIFDSYFSEAKLKKWRKKQVHCSRLGRPTYSKRLEGFSKKKKLFNTNMGKM